MEIIVGWVHLDCATPMDRSQAGVYLAEDTSAMVDGPTSSRDGHGCPRAGRRAQGAWRPVQGGQLRWAWAHGDRRREDNRGGHGSPRGRGGPRRAWSLALGEGMPRADSEVPRSGQGLSSSTAPPAGGGWRALDTTGCSGWGSRVGARLLEWGTNGGEVEAKACQSAVVMPWLARRWLRVG